VATDHISIRQAKARLRGHFSVVEVLGGNSAVEQGNYPTKKALHQLGRDAECKFMGWDWDENVWDEPLFISDENTQKSCGQQRRRISMQNHGTKLAEIAGTKSAGPKKQWARLTAAPVTLASVRH
jgi:hypothetical protein